jgi:hypothetical protein
MLLRDYELCVVKAVICGGYNGRTCGYMRETRNDL